MSKYPFILTSLSSISDSLRMPLNTQDMEDPIFFDQRLSMAMTAYQVLSLNLLSGNELFSQIFSFRFG